MFVQLLPRSLPALHRSAHYQEIGKSSTASVVETSESNWIPPLEICGNSTTLEVNSCAELGALFGYGSVLFSNATSSRPAASAPPPTFGPKGPKQKKGKNNILTEPAVSIEQAIDDLEKLGQVVRSKKAEKKDFTAELTKLKTLKLDYGPTIEQFVKDHINDPGVDIDKIIIVNSS